MNSKRQHPVAVCTDCITYVYDTSVINQACTVRRGDRQCQGTYVDATASINWKECTACSGTALAFDGTPCVACQESGWLLTRRR